MFIKATRSPPCRHFILNNQETNRGSVNAIVDERALQEIYMTPFRAGARAGAASAMCSFVSSPCWMCHVSTHPRHYADPHSYNRVNGTYACGLGSSLNRNLKGDLNWTGFITSDWSSADVCSLRVCERVCVCERERERVSECVCVC